MTVHCFIHFQIREETDTKIDLPSENSDSDVIVITGKKDNVEQAKQKIEAIQKELVCLCLCVNLFLKMANRIWCNCIQPWNLSI